MPTTVESGGSPWARRRACLGALAALALAGSACLDGEPPRPDLLLVSSSPVGHHGWDHEDLLFCPEAARSGSEPDPRFACRLAARGAYYRWAFSAAADPAPSIASLFTSLPAHRHGVTRSPATFARSETVTLAEQLAQAGYATAGFTGRPRLNRARDLDQGFELYWVAGEEHDAGDPIRAAAAWIALQREYDRPWFAWIGPSRRAGPGRIGAAREARGSRGRGRWHRAAARRRGDRHPERRASGSRERRDRGIGELAGRARTRTGTGTAPVQPTGRTAAARGRRAGRGDRPRTDAAALGCDRGTRALRGRTAADRAAPAGGPARPWARRRGAAGLRDRPRWPLLPALPTADPRDGRRPRWARSGSGIGRRGSQSNRPIGPIGAGARRAAPPPVGLDGSARDGGARPARPRHDRRAGDPTERRSAPAPPRLGAEAPRGRVRASARGGQWTHGADRGVGSHGCCEVDGEPAQERKFTSSGEGMAFPSEAERPLPFPPSRGGSLRKPKGFRRLHRPAPSRPSAGRGHTDCSPAPRREGVVVPHPKTPAYPKHATGVRRRFSVRASGRSDGRSEPHRAASDRAAERDC